MAGTAAVRLPKPFEPCACRGHEPRRGTRPQAEGCAGHRLGPDSLAARMADGRSDAAGFSQFLADFLGTQGVQASIVNPACIKACGARRRGPDRPVLPSVSTSGLDATLRASARAGPALTMPSRQHASRNLTVRRRAPPPPPWQRRWLRISPRAFQVCAGAGLGWRFHGLGGGGSDGGTLVPGFASAAGAGD
jgi:hypothetical protein